MVKLSRLYLALVLTAAVILVVPATRQALVRSPLVAGLDSDDGLFLGLGDGATPEEAADVAASINEAWAYAAAAELQPLGSAAQASLFDQAAQRASGDGELLLRRAELAVGAAFDDLEQVDPLVARRAERTIAELPEPVRHGAYALLLRASAEAVRSDWPAVTATLAAVPEAPMATPYESAAARIARLQQHCGLPALEARAQATVGLLLPDFQVMREMARRVADRVAELRAAGREREAIELALALAKASARLRQSETMLIPALVSVAMESLALKAGEPELEPPAELRQTAEGHWWVARQHAAQFAARLERHGLAADAAWVRSEIEVMKRVKDGARAMTQSFPGLGPVDRPLQAMLFWGVLSVIFAITAVLTGAALMLCGVSLRRAAWLPWRGSELAALGSVGMLLALPLAVMGAARLLPAATQGPPAAAQAALAMLVLAGLLAPLTVAAACWLLGFKYARRTGARGLWPSLEAAGHFASRAVAVPTLACQALLLALALLCAVPIAWQRHRAAEAFGQVFAYESQVIADAVAGRK